VNSCSSILSYVDMCRIARLSLRSLQLNLASTPPSSEWALLLFSFFVSKRKQSHVTIQISASRQAIFDSCSYFWIYRTFPLLVVSLQGRSAHQDEIISRCRLGCVPTSQTQDGTNFSAGDGASIPPNSVEVFYIVANNFYWPRVCSTASNFQLATRNLFFSTPVLLEDPVSDISPDSFSRDGVLYWFLP